MTARVDTLNHRVDSQTWLLPALFLFSSSATRRLVQWWQQRSSTLVMSDEWLHEFRSRRDR
ncbi:MAG TPA: hypothetical protein VH436_32600 [Vicinamibacterales bacterium]|jgi:hypothetical protein